MPYTVTEVKPLVVSGNTRIISEQANKQKYTGLAVVNIAPVELPRQPSHRSRGSGLGSDIPPLAVRVLSEPVA